MRADNSQHVVAATRHRTERTRHQVVAALRRMDATGTPITFNTLAREAGVSRSWLYTQQDLRVEVERLRARHQPRTTTAVPPQQQRASDTSLLCRLEASTDRICGSPKIVEGHTAQDRCLGNQVGQHCRGHGVELADVAEGEGPQERAQRRGRPDSGEQRVHPTVAQQVHVLDAVRPGDHPRHRRRHLQRRVGCPLTRQGQRVCHQVAQPGLLRQRHHRRQTTARHEIRVIKYRRDLRRSVRNSHLTDPPLRG